MPFKAIGTGVAVRERDGIDAPRPAFLPAGDDRPFFFFVGVVQPKKNVHTLLPLLTAFPDHRLVIAGPDGHPYAQRVRDQAAQLGVADRVLMPGPVTEAHEGMVVRAVSCIHVSRRSRRVSACHVAEAMTFGKPAFISRLTSLPEIGGDDAYYFGDFEAAGMVEVVRAGLRDFDGRIRAGRSDCAGAPATYTWESVAGEYWTVYEGLASAGVGSRRSSTPVVYAACPITAIRSSSAS